LRQTILPQEIVIADDGSTENTSLMLQDNYKESPVPIIHVWHEDKGFRAAKIRNRAIVAASGEYIILCDDDAIPSLFMVEDHVRYAENGYFIQGHRVLLGHDISNAFTFRNISLMNILKLALNRQAGNYFNALRLPIAIIRESNKKIKGIRSCNMSFFRKDIIAVNGFNEDFEGWGNEDVELAVRLYKYGLKVRDIKFKACCYHLYHEPYSRHNLQKNIKLFKDIMNGEIFFCKNGIDKYLNGA
jgi:glycosyltransferase involved in cell wall biosynthesis